MIRRPPRSTLLSLHDALPIFGNNGIWALEHHPMKFLYGYSLAAELTPETRYDEVVSALGCHGELVRSPDELQPALEDRKSTRLNSSHANISYAVFCLKKKK